MFTPDAVQIRHAREAFDPHLFMRDGSVYCNVSRRTEGTVNMYGGKCSNCGYENPR